MKKIYSLILLAVVALCAMPQSASLYAQEHEDGFDRNRKFELYVGDITYTPKSKETTTGSKVLDVIAAVATGEFTENYDSYADAVKANIVKGLSWAFRFKVMDRQFDPESDKMDYALFIDGTISRITTTTRVFTEEVKQKDGTKKSVSKEKYQAVIMLTLNLKDLAHGTIINSNTFRIESNEYSSSWFLSRQAALDKAIEYVANYVTRYYDDVYPLTADIIELGTDKNDKQKEVYIDLGSKHGVYEGLTFGVYKLKTIAGRDARTYLGRLKVKKVEGPEVSFCKVVSGGKDIKKCLDDNDTLLIISRH